MVKRETHFQRKTQMQIQSYSLNPDYTRKSFNEYEN